MSTIEVETTVEIELDTIADNVDLYDLYHAASTHKQRELLSTAINDSDAETVFDIAEDAFGLDDVLVSFSPDSKEKIASDYLYSLLPEDACGLLSKQVIEAAHEKHLENNPELAKPGLEQIMNNTAPEELLDMIKLKASQEYWLKLKAHIERQVKPRFPQMLKIKSYGDEGVAYGLRIDQRLVCVLKSECDAIPVGAIWLDSGSATNLRVEILQ